MMRRTAFTRMPNELLDALAAGRLNAREMRVVLAVLRRSAGYNRGQAVMATHEVAAAAGMDPQQVRLVLARLVALGALHVTGTTTGKAPLTLHLHPPAAWRDAAPPAAASADAGGYGPGYGEGYAGGYAPGYAPGYGDGYAPGYETQQNAGPKPAPSGDRGEPKDKKDRKTEKQKDMSPTPPGGGGVLYRGHDDVDTPPSLAACKAAFDAWKRIVGAAVLPRWRYDDIRNAVEASGLTPEAWAAQVQALVAERRAREPRWQVTSPAYFHRAVLERAGGVATAEPEDDYYARFDD
jgi:phage replication O-like protein O